MTTIPKTTYTDVEIKEIAIKPDIAEEIATLPTVLAKYGKEIYEAKYACIDYLIRFIYAKESFKPETKDGKESDYISTETENNGEFSVKLKNRIFGNK